MTTKGFHGVGKYVANYLRTTMTFEEILQTREMGTGLYFYTSENGISTPDEIVLRLLGSYETSFDAFYVLSAYINIRSGTLFIDTEDDAVISAICNILSRAGSAIPGNSIERFSTAIMLLLEGTPEMRDVVIRYPVMVTHPSTKKTHYATAIFMSNGRHINQATIELKNYEG